MVPCKECIALAACRQKRRVIRCDLLFDWYWKIPYHELYEREDRIKRYLTNWNSDTTLIARGWRQMKLSNPCKICLVKMICNEQCNESWNYNEEKEMWSERMAYIFACTIWLILLGAIIYNVIKLIIQELRTWKHLAQIV